MRFPAIQIPRWAPLAPAAKVTRLRLEDRIDEPYVLGNVSVLVHVFVDSIPNGVDFLAIVVNLHRSLRRFLVGGVALDARAIILTLACITLPYLG